MMDYSDDPLADDIEPEPYHYQSRRNDLMPTNINPAHVVTGKVRLSYAHLNAPYKSQLANENDKAKYSATLLIPKSDTATKAKIDAAIRAAGEKGLASGKLSKGTPINKLPTPIWDGDGYRADGYTPFGDECKGMWVMTASSDTRPRVVDLDRNDILDATEIYSGMWARVGLDFYAYNNRKMGIGCGLGNVQKIADDEPLGATPASVDDDFGSGEFDPLG